jgi:adenine-specific DNA-methyltransferase
MNNYENLQKVLKEIFEMDKADLDFGIYRIMNQKREQVMQFIDTTLPKDIKEILEQTQSKDTVSLQAELEQMGKGLDAAGVDRNSAPKYLALQQQIAGAVDTNALEQEVFSHLASFFKRYYKDGDFISLRRYKKDVYAIPYEGEEVKLHWANHDQYYIKTSEYLKNYGFKLSDGKKINFVLKEASTEQNNNKTQGDSERRFAIFEELPLEVINGELNINFTYETHAKTVKQEDLAKQALETIQATIPGEFVLIFDKAPTEKNKGRTVLEKHISNFISRNSFDYFIHKDLGSFLNRELDFYIKNEVLFIDDINTENPIYFTAQLSKIKALKTVANKIITFLAQIENFQKKLWLKKKFVISTNYCITLDRIPEKYYPEIVANQAQLDEWKAMFDVEITDASQLVFEQFLVLDTKHFSQEFKDKLLDEFDDLDEETDGLLINSENFQALSVLQEKYLKTIDAVYGDPPYNAKSSEIIYKNSFKHSSWISFMYDRVNQAANLKSQKGALITAIDENEVFNLVKTFDQMYPEWKQTVVTVLHNPAGVQGDNFSYSHEFAIFMFENHKHIIGKTKKENETIEPFRDWGPSGTRNPLGNTFYPIIVDLNGENILGFGDACKSDFHPVNQNIQKENHIEVYPIGDDGNERKWVFARDTVEDISDELFVSNNNGVFQIMRTKSKGSFKTVWSDNSYYANIHGSKLLNNITGNKVFDFPKSVYTVKDCLFAVSKIQKGNGLIIDYFAGSGTTGHATIKLNREDGGKRKYILVEMGTYFNTVTKPRIQKVIYSDNWKNGKPQDKVGISQIFKYQVLESYEDTLNNLLLPSANASGLLQFSQEAQEDYLLKYMLDVETEGHLFNLQAFKNPFNYQLNVTENNELVPTTVDLIETFNYLIGLYVQRIQRVKDIKLVEGKTRTGEKTLVIWRNLETTSNDETEAVFRKLYDTVRSSEFDQIYINGDHHFENVRAANDQFKVKLIEDAFFKLMFNSSEL